MQMKLKGAMSNLNSKIDTSVQKLKIGKDGPQRKEEHEALETRTEAKLKVKEGKFRMNTHS